MPIEVARLRRSKAWLIAKRIPELGFFMMNLWQGSWHEMPAGSLEDDDDVLADVAMCDPKRWKKFKADAMRGWVKCSDGRLYHPIVAEKVNAAWFKKVHYAWKKECDRIRKENKKREADGKPPLVFPPEPLPPSIGIPLEESGIPQESEGIPAENALKGEERNRKGEEGINKTYVPTASDGADKPDPKPRKHHGSEEDHTAAHWIFDRVLLLNPTAKAPNWDAWANEVRLMREIDGRSHHDICELFAWVQRDAFWCANILSPAKLREKWDALVAKRGRPARDLQQRPSIEDLNAQRAAEFLGTAPAGDTNTIDMEA
nr:DUF1376 domain-containing protein [Massilia sp. TS11]